MAKPAEYPMHGATPGPNREVPKGTRAPRPDWVAPAGYPNLPPPTEPFGGWGEGNAAPEYDEHYESEPGYKSGMTPLAARVKPAKGR